MHDGHAAGRLLIVVGLALVAIGALLAWKGRLPWLGRLPGDFVWKGDGWTIAFPLGTCIVVSVLLSLIVGWLTRR